MTFAKLSKFSFSIHLTLMLNSLLVNCPHQFKCYISNLVVPKCLVARRDEYDLLFRSADCLG